jgi:HEPN domain-containing protein
MPHPERLKEASEWLRYAAEDLQSAELLASTNPPRLRQALFHAEQATEKALKSFLISQNRPYPLTHNLTLLRDLCGEIDPSLLDVIAPALRLTDFAIRFRYPGNVTPDLRAEDGTQWIAAARNVYSSIAGRMPDVAF